MRSLDDFYSEISSIFQNYLKTQNKKRIKNQKFYNIYTIVDSE